MKLNVKGGKAMITAGMNTPIKDYYKEAEERFLKDVEKGIKKVVGNKVKTKVVNRTTTVWLEGEGVNLSDMEVSFHIYLIPVRDFDIKLFIQYDDVMRGRSSDEISFKTGTLNPNEAVNAFKRYWR